MSTHGGLDLFIARCHDSCMRQLWFIVGLLVLGIYCPISSQAQTVEEVALGTARKALQDHFYERAEKELGEFIVRFSDSTYALEAQLLQAQARYHSRLFDAAYDLLNRGLPKAGMWVDHYLLWMGTCQMARGDFEGAAANFGRLCRDHPQSPLRLEASYSQALAKYRKQELPAAMELLGNAQGNFQKAAQGLTNNTVAMGYLLLGRMAVMQNETAQAQQALRPLGSWKLPPNLDWERFDLLARSELAAGHTANALLLTTNALTVAETSQYVGLKGDTLSLQAEIFRRIGRLTDALGAYDTVAQATNMPPQQRRQAAMQGAELLLTQGKREEAVARLEGFLSARPLDDGADVFHLKSGELQLDSWRSQSDKSKAALLVQARLHFDTIILQITNSTVIGKAWLGKGWSYWEDVTMPLPKRMVEAQNAFQAASKLLVRAEDQSVAKFKLADTFYAQSQLAKAVTNYQEFITQFGNLPGAGTNFAAQAMHQIVRGQIALGETTQALQSMETFVNKHPKSSQAEESWLAIAQHLIEKGALVEGRQLLVKFIEERPSSPMRALAELSRARSFSYDDRWAEGASELQQWTGSYSNHPSIGEAQFDRAWMTFRAGDETNSFQLFTNFLGKYPLHTLAPMAQNWVADYYYNREQWGSAEKNYQLLFQTPNPPAKELAFQARLMAARTAILRQGYNDARGYLTNLLGDAQCPTNLAPEAWFMLGDVIIEQRITTSTNSLNNYIEALNAFAIITKQYVGHRLEPLAYGKTGDCYLQLAAQFPEYYGKATNAYLKVLQSANAPVAAKNQAEFGLALALEKLSESNPPSTRAALLKGALNHLLNILYAKDLQGQPSDPYWMKKAGLAAGRIAELVNDKGSAVALYRRLAIELPSLRTVWDAKIRSLEISVPAKP